MSMNLAQYSQMPKNTGGEFLKWTRNGETKILRFLYTSRDGADIPVVQKYWNETERRFIYNTPEGKPTCVLSCVLYEGQQAPKKVRWERSAAFAEQVCNGYWSKFPRIIDGVWEVTCTNPGTKDIKFSWFPVMNADFTTHPLPEGVRIEDGQVVDDQAPAVSTAAPTDNVIPPWDAPTSPETVVDAPTSNRKYWE